MGTILKHYEHIFYADDVVCYTSGKLCEKIEQGLNDDLDSVANWLGENNLILNLKKTKTECVLFGTHQKSYTNTKIGVNSCNATDTDYVLFNTDFERVNLRFEGYFTLV